MKRLMDPVICKAITDKHKDYFTFDEDKWFSNLNNFGYIEGQNVGFGEFKSPGCYWVHLCCDEAKGREAVELTKKMVGMLYEDTQFNSLVALIHVDNKKAKWLIRQVGFKSLGVTDTPNGLCEMFCLTKKDYLTDGI